MAAADTSYRFDLKAERGKKVHRVIRCTFAGGANDVLRLLPHKDAVWELKFLGVPTPAAAINDLFTAEIRRGTVGAATVAGDSIKTWTLIYPTAPAGSTPMLWPSNLRNLTLGIQQPNVDSLEVYGERNDVIALSLTTGVGSAAQVAYVEVVETHKDDPHDRVTAVNDLVVGVAAA